MESRQYGICIGTRRWKDNDRMLSLFCEDGCVYDVLARGALKPKYKLKFAAQLFSTADYSFASSRAGYSVLEGAGFGELSFLGISTDPVAYAAACVVCEIASKCVMGENKTMYSEVLAALGELAASSESADAVVLRVLIAAFVSNGYGAAFPSGRGGEICSAVYSARLGEVSNLSIEPRELRPLVRTFSSRFASRFEKLESMSFYIAEV